MGHYLTSIFSTMHDIFISLLLFGDLFPSITIPQRKLTTLVSFLFFSLENNINLGLKFNHSTCSRQLYILSYLGIFFFFIFFLFYIPIILFIISFSWDLSRPFYQYILSFHTSFECVCMCMWVFAISLFHFSFFFFVCIFSLLQTSLFYFNHFFHLFFFWFLYLFSSDFILFSGLFINSLSRYSLIEWYSH